MAAQRQDYILRQIELLRQFVARLARERRDGTLDEALSLAFHLQEKLFPLPVAEFLRLDADGQVAALSRNESPVHARANCATYAALLKETAALYSLAGRAELARGARQLALHVALTTALGTEPGRERQDLERLARELARDLDGTELPPPLQEMLERLDLPTG